MDVYSPDLKHINPLIKDYEILIQTLTEQLDHYQLEQDQLKTDVTTLLQENRTLSCQVKKYLKMESDVDSRHQYSGGDFINNLQNQINLLVKEKESAVSLWQTSLLTIEQLEEELRLFEGRSHGYVSKENVKKMQAGYEAQLKTLQTEVMESRAKLAESDKCSSAAIQDKTNELRVISEIHQNTLKTVQVLEEENRRLQSEHVTDYKKANNLIKCLQQKDITIKELQVRDVECKSKVSEAIQIVEAALMEKDAALLRENQIKDEMRKMSDILSEVIEETNSKLKQELEQSKQQYSDKLNKIKKDMKNVLQDLETKDNELEKHRNMSKVLEEEVERLRKGNVNFDESHTSKLLVLEKNLESTFQKLLLSEKKNIQLSAEKESIKEDLEQMAKHYESDIKSREVEKQVLQRKIVNLQNEMDISNNGLVEVADKVEEVNRKISMIETELTKQMYTKDVKSEKIFSNKISEMELSHAKINNELKSRLEAQISFNKKWKAEVHNITGKLEERVHELRKESSVLKKQNKDLRQKLLEAENKIEIYREHLKTLCVGVAKVANLSKEESNK